MSSFPSFSLFKVLYRLYFLSYKEILRDRNCYTIKMILYVYINLITHRYKLRDYLFRINTFCLINFDLFRFNGSCASVTKISKFIIMHDMPARNAYYLGMQSLSSTLFFLPPSLSFVLDF